MYGPKPIFSTESAHNNPIYHDQQIGQTTNNAASNIGGNSSSNSFATRQRLRWTDELHGRFLEAVTQLGGPDSKFLCLFSLLFSLTCYIAA